MEEGCRVGVQGRSSRGDGNSFWWGCQSFPSGRARCPASDTRWESPDDFHQRSHPCAASHLHTSQQHHSYSMAPRPPSARERQKHRPALCQMPALVSAPDGQDPTPPASRASRAAPKGDPALRSCLNASRSVQITKSSPSMQWPRSRGGVVQGGLPSALAMSALLLAMARLGCWSLLPRQ